MPKVSVIIPVYGVEKYIERCARSLFEQTLDDIEYLFIDDCTPDGSVEILKRVLEDYPQRKTQTIIHRMEQNSGQARVREWGMKNATGEYVIHCDSDDWVDTDMYRAMYNKAKVDRADVVVCDFSRTDGINHQAVCGCHTVEPIRFIENCLYQKDPWSLCNKIFLRNHIENIVYPDGALGEDMMICIQLLSKCKVITYINKVFYYYYFNPGSITKSRTVAKCLQNYNTLKSNTDFVVKFLNERYSNSSLDLDLICKYLKMINSFSLLYIKHIPDYNSLWKNSRVIMSIRFYFNPKISGYNKLIYILSFIGVYPRKKDYCYR